MFVPDYAIAVDQEINHFHLNTKMVYYIMNTLIAKVLQNQT